MEDKYVIIKHQLIPNSPVVYQSEVGQTFDDFLLARYIMMCDVVDTLSWLNEERLIDNTYSKFVYVADIEQIDRGVYIIATNGEFSAPEFIFNVIPMEKNLKTLNNQVQERYWGKISVEIKPKVLDSGMINYYFTTPNDGTSGIFPNATDAYYAADDYCMWSINKKPEFHNGHLAFNFKDMIGTDKPHTEISRVEFAIGTPSEDNEDTPPTWIPQAPVTDPSNVLLCPRCNEPVNRSQYKYTNQKIPYYCRGCGQSIDLKKHNNKQPK